ncbi:MAG: hypothetical protein WCJ72_12570 [Chryseobacterium sp.]
MSINISNAHNLNNYQTALNNYFDGKIDVVELVKIASINGFSHHDLLTEIDCRAKIESTWEAKHEKCTGNDISDHVITQLYEDRVLKDQSEYKRELRGLPNLGNTCFMNASLQGLAEMSGILESLSLELKESPDRALRIQLQKSVKELITELKSKHPNANAIGKGIHSIANSPLIKNKFKTICRTQEDAEEFIRYLHDKLEIDTASSASIQVARKSMSSHELIGGNPVSTGIFPLLNTGDYIGAENQQIKLQDLLNRNLLPYEEPSCASEAGKRVRVVLNHDNLDTLSHLSLQLPRFGVDTNKCRGKITNVFDEISIPINNDNIRLNPVSVVCHLGNTRNSGHYITIVRDGNGFKEISDSYSRQLSTKDAMDIVTKSGYIVNYQRIAN